VRSTDEVKVELRQEGADDTATETVRNTPLVVLPVQRRVARIAPKQVVEQTVIGDVRRPRDPSDVVHGRERGRETSMNAEDLARNDSSDRQAVERVDERLPDLDVAPPLALVVEAVDCENGRGE
jgi:hypothetical protein